MTLKEVESIFKSIIDEENIFVKLYDSVFEKPDDGDFLKMVISLHQITTPNNTIVHTKFVFKSEKDKYNLFENEFFYLYDLNCNYKRRKFIDQEDLKEEIKKIIESNNFGDDIKYLSEFIEAPAMLLNYYFKKMNFEGFSVFEVIYDPKFKVVPCEDVTFDFDISINNNYKANLSIKKSEDNYLMYLKFMDEVSKKEFNSMEGLHTTIGSFLIKTINKKLMNK